LFFGLLATTFIVTAMFLKTRENILLLKLAADSSCAFIDIL